MALSYFERTGGGGGPAGVQEYSWNQFWLPTLSVQHDDLDVDHDHYPDVDNEMIC